MSTIDIKTNEVQIQLSKISLAVHENNKTIDQFVNKLPLKIQKDEPQVRLKSTLRKIIIGLIISLSALTFGYSLKQITSVPIAVIMHEYGITINKFAAQSILIGILPIGAILGVIVTKCLITRYRRLTGIYIFTFVNIGAMVLVNITNFGSLIAGRFIEGICVGYYTTIAPIYLKEIAPKELRKMLGLFFSFGKIIGVLIVIIMELGFEDHPVDYSWRIILSMTGVFSILQAILIFFFGSDTPAEMIEKGNEVEALKIIEKFYKEQYVKEVFNEYKKEFQMEIAKGIETRSQDLNIPQEKRKAKKLIKQTQLGLQFEESINKIQSMPHVFKPIDYTIKQQEPKLKEGELTFEDKKKSAYIMGIHLCIIRHLTGGNAIITQGGLFIKDLDAQLGNYTSIIINSVQFIFIVIGLIYIQKIAGKRALFLISISCLSLLNIALAVAMLYYKVLPCVMIMCIFMAVYGGSFISPIWSYPSEVIPASQAMVPNIVHWLALAISTLVPPVITGIMPGNNAYPVFLFFGFYGIFAFIHVFTKMKESDGKSYNEIIKSFK